MLTTKIPPFRCLLALSLLCTLSLICTLAGFGGQGSFFPPVSEPVLDIGRGEQAIWALVYDGRSQALFTSRDSGMNWHRIDLNNLVFHNLEFLNDDMAWATGMPVSPQHTLKIFRTANGGIKWEEISSLQTVIDSISFEPKGLLFQDESNGWIWGNGPSGQTVLWQTQNGGTSFYIVDLFSNQSFLIRSMFGTQKGSVWAVGNRLIGHTSDLGKSWRIQVSPHQNGDLPVGLYLNGGYGFPDGKAWIAGGVSNAVLLSTVDFGEHWHVTASQDHTSYFSAIAFWDKRHGCAVGSSTVLFCTSNGGQSWQGRDILPRSEARNAFMNNLFLKIMFAKDGRKGWLLSATGRLYETSDGGTNWHPLDLLKESTTGNNSPNRTER